MAEVDSNTKLLVHFDGDDGTTEATDESANAHILTAFNEAQIDTAQSKFGGASVLYDGTNDYFSIPDHTDWDLFTTTSSPFTIECWVRFADGSPQGILDQHQDNNNFWYVDSTGSKLRFFSLFGGSTKLYIACNWSPSVDTWYHIAIVRSATTRFIFIDGVSQSLSNNTNNALAALNGTVQTGFNRRNSTSFNGWIDELRVSDVARWTAGFTPPTEAYGPSGPPPPPSPIYIDRYYVEPTNPRRLKPPTNPGDFDVAGLHIPVSIKMDKWQNLSQPPARRKKTNPANTTQIVFVDFTVPVLPTIFIDRWLNPHYPRKPKTPRVLPASFATSQVAVLSPINGNYIDTGIFGFEITVVHTAEEQTYRDTGVIGLAITVVHTEDFQLEDTGVFGFKIEYPDVGVESFNSGVPGFVSANVTINGINRSNFVTGIISVTREDNAAARFQLNLEEDPDEGNPPKPIEFINKIISINFAAAGMDGVVSDYVPIFVGIIKQVSFNEDKRTLKLGGYDYSGIHQTRGEYISENITDVLTGSIGAGSAGTLNTGHNPIWGVVWNGNNAVKDGQDYFVDTKNGQIVIPISSRILQFPGHFTYNYANNFNTMKDIIQAVASEKSWTIEEDRVTIADYTTGAAHPVLSLSDESIIDTCRKFLELSGAKIEGNLFPKLRVYSEVENWINPVDVLVLDEGIIFEDSLTYGIDFDNLLNEQTTRSVQRVDAEIVVGAGETIATFEADAPSTNPFTVQSGVTWVWKLDLSTPTILAEHRIAKQGLNSISLSASGQFFLALWPVTFSEPITGSSFNVFIDGDDFVIQLSHTVTVINYLNLTLYAYPAFQYTLTVNGSRINYGGGSPEDVRIVTAQRPIGGITETLKGDVYENPYIETDGHCANICNAVLLEHGNPYTADFEIPLFEGKAAQIGNRVDIKRDTGTIFSGIIKRLGYQMNLANGQNRVSISAKGIGKGI